MSERDDNGLRRDFEILKGILDERMKTMKAENETAYERLRTDIEKAFNAVTNRMMIGLGISVAFLSAVIGFVTLFMNGNG